MLASHSPVVLSLVKQEEVLCFAKTSEGIADIVKGSEHPALKDWQGETNWKEEESLKPDQPKEAFETVLRLCGMPRSSSIYRDIAERAS